LPTETALDRARTFFEVLTEDGVSPRKAYEAANRLLPEGVDLRDFDQDDQESTP
jgi:hypothetical protein